MSVILGVSLGILAWTLVGALRLLRRTGEVRVGLVAGLVVLLGLATGALLAASAARPLAVDATSAAALASLCASVAALLVLRAFASTLEELDVAEALHWGSMQGVRAVTQLAAQQRGEPAQRLASLLELGCERFGLEVGFLSRIEGDQHEIRALHAPDDCPLAVGARMPLGATLCRHTLAAERPVAVEQVSAAAWARPDDADPLGFEAYLGAAVLAGGRPFGILVFGSRSAQAQRFTASHKDLLALMAQWAGIEIERREAPAARADAPARRQTPALVAAGACARPRGSGIDLNEVLRRVERRIRDLVEPRVRLVVRASPEPAFARHPGLAPESLLLTLVGHAVDAMQGAGTLTLAAEPLSGDTGRWVTVSVSHTGRGPDAEALARAFTPARDAPRDGLALGSLVRALRRGGGDLSVEVEPSRGSTFTVFLPACTGDAPGRRPPRAAAAASPPPGSEEALRCRNA